MIIRSKRIMTPLRTIDGYIEIDNGIIKRVSAGEPKTDNYEDYSDYIIMPGFIDLHVHGYGTGSLTHEKSMESVIRMGQSMTRQGVTSFLPTTGTDSLEATAEMMSAIDKAMDSWDSTKGAEILGAHLEGPFINKEYKGMQKEEYCIHPSIDIFKTMCESLPIERIQLMTMAPELDNALELISYLNENDVQISIGHSAATFDTIKKLKNFGLGGVTHMFSGMKGFHHRELGVAGSALYFDDLYCEFAKQTGLTVLPEAVDLTVKVKGFDRITLCSDAVGLGHVQEPFYHYIRKTEFVPCGDYVLLKNDNGNEKKLNRFSIEDMTEIEMGYLESVKNLVNINGFTLQNIMKIASENTAKYINQYHRKGSLEEKKDADIIVLDENLALIQSYVLGTPQINV
ncbi:N-acetylglucosamine-6-phosphate deacetylase [Fundicoccus sp. Sow4_H7]|uniref:N-acetylglucosamine-6-phosphate deacetylase n=1 Tax=Fundicoccus sp. Sow4_H7 TaxID=3438784 RepID=UPI003F90DFE5